MSRRTRRGGWLSALLGVSSVLVVVGIGHSLIVRGNTATPPIEISADGAEIAALSLAPEIVFPPAEAFVAVVERPLFSATRRPPLEPAIAVLEPTPEAEPVAEAPPSPPPVALGQFTLVGVIDDGVRRVALVRHAEEPRLLRVEVGDVVHDWQVVRIGLDSVELAAKDIHEVVILKPAETYPVADAMSGLAEYEFSQFGDDSAAQ